MLVVKGGWDNLQGIILVEVLYNIPKNICENVLMILYEVKSGLGTGAIIVIDATGHHKMYIQIIHFKHESCGQYLVVKAVDGYGPLRGWKIP